ncbi:BatA domain-containing protein [Halocola ammonii]
MKFLYPEILYALSAVAIPIIVHLFNFRRFKKVKFSNISFLKEVKIETRSKSRLKHILILISRILAITFIVFAFAQPYIQETENQRVAANQAVSIYIDNSFSMEAENEEGPLLQVAKNKALEIVESYSATDQFQLLTNEFEGRHQRFYNQDEMIELIEEIGISPRTRKTSEAISRQKEMLQTAPDSELSSYIISDLQESTTDLTSLENDTTLDVVFVPTQAERVANIYIDSLWFSSPIQQVNQSEKLNIRIKNTLSQSVDNVPLTLTINGTQKALGSFNATPGDVTDTSLVFSNNEPGLKSGVVTLQDHPIVFDDKFYFSYKIKEKINVLELRPADLRSNNISAVFSGDDHFEFTQTSTENIDYSEFAASDLIILNQISNLSSGMSAELEKFTKNGGSTLFIPASEADIDSYNGFLRAMGSNPIQEAKSIETKVSDINLDNYIFKDVFDQIPQNIDLPSVKKYYPYQRLSRTGEEPLLTIQTGDSFLSYYKVGDGKLYTSAVSLLNSESNFTQHAVFVTTLLRIAEFSQPTPPIYYTIGQNEALTLQNIRPSGDQVFKVREKEQQFEFIPEHRQSGPSTEIYVRNQVTSAGNYELLLAEEPVSTLSFNYSRDESNLRVIEVGNLESELQKFGLSNFRVIDSKIETLANNVKKLSAGNQFWRSCIIMALIFLAIEIILIKFWRR